MPRPTVSIATVAASGGLALMLGCRGEAASAPPSHGARASSDAVELVPGAAIGPIRLGMSRAEIEAMGVLRPDPRFSAQTLPYTVLYDEADRARAVRAVLRSLPAGIRVGDTILPPSASLSEAAGSIGSCLEPEVNEGGSVVLCRGGTIELTVGSAQPDAVAIGIRR